MIFLIVIFCISFLSQNLLSSDTYLEPLLPKSPEISQEFNQGPLGPIQRSITVCCGTFYDCASKSADQSSELGRIGDGARALCFKVPETLQRPWRSLAPIRQDKVACGCVWIVGCAATGACCMPCCG